MKKFCNTLTILNRTKILRYLGEATFYQKRMNELLNAVSCKPFGNKVN